MSERNLRPGDTLVIGKTPYLVRKVTKKDVIIRMVNNAAKRKEGKTKSTEGEPKAKSAPADAGALGDEEQLFEQTF